MTYYYDYVPYMPQILSVRCPRCGAQAEFEFAVLREISKKDAEHFKAGHAFAVYRHQSTYGQFWHAAYYFRGLHGDPERALHNLPVGYKASDWSWGIGRRSQVSGSIRCDQCHFRARRELGWPADAYYAVAYKGHVLWAFNRASAIALNDYLSSKLRNVSKKYARWEYFFRHIPTVFKTAKARIAVTKHLRRLLYEASA